MKAKLTRRELTGSKFVVISLEGKTFTFPIVSRNKGYIITRLSEMGAYNTHKVGEVQEWESESIFECIFTNTMLLRELEEGIVTKKEVKEIAEVLSEEVI